MLSILIIHSGGELYPLTWNILRVLSETITCAVEAFEGGAQILLFVTFCQSSEGLDLCPDVAKY